MTENMPYFIFETPMGWAGIAGSEGLVAHLVLPNLDRECVKAALRARISVHGVEAKGGFSGIAESVTSYFAGRRTDFECYVDPGDAGSFDISVWNAAREIGYGEVRSYRWIADRIGRPNAYRAVGQALGRNPVPIIVPCHRVLRSDGALGGFSSGLHWKERLLELERGRSA